MNRKFRGLGLGDVHEVAAPGSEGFDDFANQEVIVIAGFTGPNSRGRVAFRGTEWEAECASLLVAGARVRISGRRGAILILTPMKR